METREAAKKNNQMISDAIDALGIDQPIQRVRVVGNRVEIWPYGGSGMLVWEAETNGVAKEDLESMTVAELKDLAEREDIEVPSRIKKAELVSLIYGVLG